MTKPMAKGTPVCWESLVTPGRWFFGQVLTWHEGEIFGHGHAVVRDRNFKQPIAVKISRISNVSGAIDTTPRKSL